MSDSVAPVVSLLIPVYNVERYLDQCLQSAQRQTLENIEIICINDGSTDGSLDIMRAYAATDARFKIIDKPNSGYGNSMNRGLDACTGTFVGILESDDFLDSDALEVLSATAEKHAADVVKSDFYLYWSDASNCPKAGAKVKDGEVNERFKWVTAKSAGVYRPLNYLQVFFLKPSIWSALYRRSFLEENSIRFLETPGASYQDASFNFKVWASAEKVVLVDRAFLHYRQDNEASSVNSPGKVYCVCDEYDEMIRYVDTLPEKKDRLRSVLVRMRFDSYMWNYERLSEELQREFAERMAEDFRREDAEGVTDYALFDTFKRDRRKLAMDDPVLFHLKTSERAAPGKLNTLKRYYQTGGFPFLVELVKDKLNR